MRRTTVASAMEVKYIRAVCSIIDQAVLDEMARGNFGESARQLPQKIKAAEAARPSRAISLYSRGMTARDIQVHLEEMYGTEVFPSLISSVTDVVIEEMKAWQSRPLDPVYPIVYLDCIHVKVREVSVRVKAVISLSARPMRSDSQCLVIAVPERAAVTHRGVVQKLSDSLRMAGCGLMFTGYGGSANSTTLIEHFAPLFVRLDPVVSQRLEQNSAFLPGDRALMDAAAGANVAVIAGGIENARSLSALWSKGVRRFQGYFIQEPLSVLGHPADQ